MASEIAKPFNRSTVAWVLYDVANSAYAIPIQVVSFPIFFRTVINSGDSAVDTRWSMFLALSLGIAGVLGPFMGALADAGGLRHALFTALTIISCAATAMLGWWQPGQVMGAGATFVTAQVTFFLSMMLYDSYLVDIAPTGWRGRISSIAWGCGFLGGILCVAVCYPLVKGGVAPENVARFRGVFPVAAGLFLLLATPAFVWLPRSQRRADSTRWTDWVVAAYRQPWQTIVHWRAHRRILQFLFVYYLLSDGVLTIGYAFAPYCQRRFGLDVMQILVLTLVAQSVSFVTTCGLGWWSDHWRPKRMIMAFVVVWLAVIGVMIFGESRSSPWIVVGLIGLVLGPTLSTCRSVFAELVPTDRSSELFGFNAFAGRTSALMGPLMFGLVGQSTGSQQWALASLALLFIAGAGMLAAIDVSRGDRNDAQSD